jgi:nucleoside-diphosphate-sugar epimerase
MRVFVAGASGAIGRPLVPKLIAAGHEVTGMTRSEDSAARLREAGAGALVADVFDEERVRSGMTDAAPEVVVHQLTSLPDRLDFRDKSLYDATNRVRGEGTRILIDAARSAGARRMVAQSIAFIYAPRGDWVKDEDAPAMEDAPGPFGDATRTVTEMERAVVGADGLEGLVLRYGFFYGPGTYYASDGTTAADVRRRRQPIVGKGSGTVSFIHVEDAADATLAAVERGAPGIYNVVDDEPAPFSEWMPEYAEALGAKRPFRVPVWLAKLVAGKEVALFTNELRGASNAKAKAALGWEPRHRSWRQGFRESLGVSASRSARSE